MPQRVSSPVAKKAIYDSDLGYELGIEVIFDANPGDEIPGSSTYAVILTVVVYVRLAIPYGAKRLFNQTTKDIISEVIL